MAAESLDVLLLTSASNQCYLAGYETIMPTCYSVAIVPLEGELTFHLPEEDLPCILLSGLVTDVVVFDWSYPLDVSAQLAGAIRDRGYDRQVIGVELGKSETYAYGAMDAHTFTRLEELLPEASFKDATNLVQEVRLRKSPAELAYMRKAGELSSIGIQASLNAIQPGRTDNEVVAAAYAAMVGAGSEVMCIDPIIFAGRRGGWAPPHHMYKRVPLDRGDAIYLEYSGNYQRYNAPMMRSACIGEPTREIRSLADSCIAVVELLLDNIRPGRTGHEVAVEAKKALPPAAESVYFHGGFGYAVGLGFSPTWTEAPVYIAEGSDRSLEPGMTFHLPIWMSMPRMFSVGVSETVCVTDTACEVLTGGCGRELAIR